MTPASLEQFVEAVKKTVLANNKRVRICGLMFLFSVWFLIIICSNRSSLNGVIFFIGSKVPPPGKGALYIRPLLLGSGAILGVAPAPEYTFLIYVSPVGDYHKVSMCVPLFWIYNSAKKTIFKIEMVVFVFR